jgi:NhaP-type Na+/H+ or K+/H+ antiporter
MLAHLTLNNLSIMGITIFCGVFASKLIKHFKLPQLIAYILVGIFLGISGLKLFSNACLQNFEIVSHFALGIIGFIIGGELRWARLHKMGLSIFLITLFEAVFAFIFVTIAVFLFSKNLPLALIIGALASATDPGGTSTVIQEYRARGPVTTTLFGVVGADDAFAIMIYSFAFNIAKMLISGKVVLNAWSMSLHASTEIFFSILLGIVLGIIFVLLIPKVRFDDAKQLFSLSAVLICTGLAESLHLSLILANMVMGITICNMRPLRSKSFFMALYRLSPPVYVLFFVLVGARLQIWLLPTLGVIGLLYIIFRSLGKIFGPWFGGKIAKAPETVQKYLGLCLLPQAGVAVGLAIAASNELCKISEAGHNMGMIIINIITSTTIIFQLIGPIMTKLALVKAKEIKEDN